MPATPAVNPAPQPVSDDLVLESFHQRWRESEVDLLDFWRNQLTSRSLTLLTALIKADLEARFARGLRPSAADYLALFPDLRGDRERVVSLVYEEFCLLEERHERPEVDQFCARYGDWSDSLRSQLAYHRELSRVVGLPRAGVRYPKAGESFGPFELRSILGTGGAAQVYLAEDRSLAGRPVVLKLSDSLGVEPDILALLDHKNIVPIYSVVAVPGSELRGICMPYDRGEDLEKVLKAVAAVDQPRRAATLLDLVGVQRRAELDDDDPWKDFPATGTYTEGVAWLGVKIAGALHYLHLKGIHHRDIKPANILITPRNGLRLLDFNLAHSPYTVEFAQAASKGGTLPYMAPEQLRAFLDPAAWGEVGAAADIYACGLMLREMVTGRRPYTPDRNLPTSRCISEVLDRRRAPVTSCRDDHPKVPPSLDAIILKCLAYHPGERYATAEELSRDLRRFLKRLPPIVARSPSRVETTVNWTYRRRKIIAALGLGVVLVICGVGLLARGRGGIRQSTDFRRAEALLNTNDRANWERAVRIFRALSERHPQAAWPTLYQSVAARKLARSPEANDALDAATRRDDAIEVFRAYLAASPSDLSAWLALGKVYFGKLDFQRAEECFTAARDLDPNHPGVLTNLGELKGRQKQFLAAIDYYEAAIDRWPGDPKAQPYRPKVRQNLIKLLIDVLNGRLADLAASPRASREPARRPGIEEILKKLEAQITLLDQELRSVVIPDPGGSRSALDLYRASLASAHGFLAGLTRRGGGDEEFERAARFLDEAVKSAEEPTSPPAARDVQADRDFAKKVVELRGELGRRREACRVLP